MQNEYSSNVFTDMQISHEIYGDLEKFVDVATFK